MQTAENKKQAVEQQPDSYVRSSLQTLGWATYGMADLMLSDEEIRDLDRLAQYVRTLPVDDFGGNGRHRCYAEAIVTPSRRTLHWKPGIVGKTGALEIEYVQETEFQPEYGGVRRRFSRTSDHVLQLPLINKLIWFDLDLTGLADRAEPLLCGFHLIQLKALQGRPSRSTPDCLHRDGQPYTAVHLVNRSGVSGGLNYIAPPQYSGRDVRDVPADELSCFTLTEPLDSYIINDEAICHHVSAVTCSPGMDIGSRTVMLIDFSPIAHSSK